MKITTSELRTIIKESVNEARTTMLRESIKTRVDELSLEQLQELDEGFFSTLGQAAAGVKNVVGGAIQAGKNLYAQGAARAAIADVGKQTKTLLDTLGKYTNKQGMPADLNKQLTTLTRTLTGIQTYLAKLAAPQPEPVPTGQSIQLQPARR